MTTFNLTIDMDNDAFSDGHAVDEVADILLALAHRFYAPSLTDDFQAGKVGIRDTEGNTVGAWEVTDDDPPTPPGPREESDEDAERQAAK